MSEEWVEGSSPSCELALLQGSSVSVASKVKISQLPEKFDPETSED